MIAQRGKWYYRGELPVLLNEKFGIACLFTNFAAVWTELGTCVTRKCRFTKRWFCAVCRRILFSNKFAHEGGQSSIYGYRSARARFFEILENSGPPATRRTISALRSLLVPNGFRARSSDVSTSTPTRWSAGNVLGVYGLS